MKQLFAIMALYKKNKDNNRSPGACVARVVHFAIIENTEILRNGKNK
jgi:hypothetical protein